MACNFFKLATLDSRSTYFRWCPGRMEVFLLISSSVWSTAGTTAEESGLLSLATINRNLRGVTAIALDAPDSGDTSRKHRAKILIVPIVIGTQYVCSIGSVHITLCMHAFITNMPETDCCMVSFTN